MIIPAILENSVYKIQEKINRVMGLAERVQIDVIDGIFADNLTISPVDLLDVDFFDLGVDIHLMTEDPVNFLKESAELIERCGGVRLISQVERMEKQAEFVSLAKELGLGVGLGIDLYTPVEAIDKTIADDLNCILLMAVRAGTQGREKFSPAIVKKITEVQKRPGLFKKAGPLQIIVDGGLNPEAVKICHQSGAASFAVGSWLWEHKDIALAIKELNESAK